MDSTTVDNTLHFNISLWVSYQALREKEKPNSYLLVRQLSGTFVQQTGYVGGLKCSIFKKGLIKTKPHPQNKIPEGKAAWDWTQEYVTFFILQIWAVKNEVFLVLIV